MTGVLTNFPLRHRSNCEGKSLPSSAATLRLRRPLAEREDYFGELTTIKTRFDSPPARRYPPHPLATPTYLCQRALLAPVPARPRWLRAEPAVKSPAETTSPSVLLVEPSSEAREVLSTILQLRGLRIFEAEEPRRGLELAREQRPDVIVLDFDQPTVDAGLQSEFAAETRQPNSGLIVLGNTPPSRHSTVNRFIAKPFHYAPLVQTIERLVGKAA